MAVIKAVNSKNSINGIIRYVIDEEKTDEKLISTLNCSSETVEDEMKFTKESYGKTTGRQYKHFIQSFHPDDDIDSIKSNSIGIEWAQKVFGDFEVLIVTHKDKEHIHNHFIINSVGFKDGAKFRYSKFDLDNYKKESDKICRRENLSVIKRKNKKDYIDQPTCQLGIQGKSWKMKLLKDLDNAIESSSSKDEFIKKLEKTGYKINYGNDDIKFKAPLLDRYIGNKRLAKQFGERYEKKAIEDKLKGIK